MSISSLVVDQLEAYGIPLQYASKVTGMFKSDIFSLGLRLAFIGLLAGLVRQSFAYCRDSLEYALFPTTHLCGLARVWVGSYLAHDPEVQQQLKHCKVLANADSAHEVTKKRSEGKGYLQGTWSDDGVNATVLPNDYQEVRININGKWIWVQRHTQGYSGDPRCYDMHYRVRTWFWNAHHIKSFIIKAYNIHYDKSETDLHIYNHSPKVANWVGPVSRPCRPWSSVILPGVIKENLLKDVKNFVSEEEKSWYTSKGIPHRRGYLLHGPPGTGKTTLATALASTLRLDMYCINPAAVGMDNSKLEKCFRNCPPGSMILIEDIDCVMPINRATHNASDSTSDDGTADAAANSPAVGKEDLGPSTVTLSGLLNAIHGVSSQEDSVLFASTNYPDKLDEALRRPGRFDVHIAFDHAVAEQAIDLYKHFYPLPRIQADHPTEVQKKDIESTTSHPYKNQSDLDQAAEQFAEHIMGKNIKVSIATIQGFLLLYKKDPVMALRNVDEWAGGIRKEQFPDSSDSVEKVIVEKERSAPDVAVEERDSVEGEIIEQDVRVGEETGEKNEAEKQEVEKQVIVVREAEKQEAVQEVVLA